MKLGLRRIWEWASRHRWKSAGVLVTVGLLTAIAQFVAPQEGQASHSHAQCVMLDHTHGRWTTILEQYVQDGWVDYSSLRAEGQDELNAYLRHLSGVCPGLYDQFTGKQRIAYWLNAYNAFMVSMIIDHHPVDSVRDIGWMPLRAFWKSFIPIDVTKAAPMSLNEIEHDVLRKKFTDPRVHFAMVCASRSCPALRSEAYQADRLDEQLDQQARRFVNNPEKNRYNESTSVLELSSIFKWFRDDFEKQGNLLNFLKPYLHESVAVKLDKNELEIAFLEYDWSLNGR